MIETIYSSESKEGNTANNVQSSFKMPKNIRQVGKGSAFKKIYVEDYVMTYIKQLAGEDYSACKVAVLVGQYIKAESCRNIFIYGAVGVEDIVPANGIVFTNDIWTKVYEDMKKYFADAEIVGWFIGGPGYLLEDKDKILKAHIDNFAGPEKTLLTFDNMEKEESFLIYDNNRLIRQEGYYIYYEKNEPMQNYMIDHKKLQHSEEANYDDRVAREIRTVIQNKKPEEVDNKSVTRLMYAAGTLLAVIVLVVAAAMLSNYDQMKSMQQTMNYLTQNMEQIQEVFAEGSITVTPAIIREENSGEEDIADSDEMDSLDVEVVPGEVKPLEEAGDNGEMDKEEGSEKTEVEEDEITPRPKTNEELAGQEKNEEKVTKPKDEKPPQKKDQSTESSKQEVKYYVVVSGDTLAGISYKLYNTYTYKDEIMELNNIEDQDKIYAGQKLIVP